MAGFSTQSSGKACQIGIRGSKEVGLLGLIRRKFGVGSVAELRLGDGAQVCRPLSSFRLAGPSPKDGLTHILKMGVEKSVCA